MTKYLLLYVTLLIALAASDGLMARAAGTLPHGTIGDNEQAVESNVHDKRVLLSRDGVTDVAD